MSSGLKRKAALLAGVVLICMVVMGVVVSTMQTNLSLENARQEMAVVAESLPETLDAANEETAQNKETYDAIFQSKAESISFAAHNDAGFEVSNAKMTEYAELLEVENVLVVQRDGTILAQAQETPADFSRARFNQLRTVFDTGEPSEAVNINLPDQDWVQRYWAAPLDDNTMIVVSQNPQELTDLINDTGSLKSVLSGIVVGQSGYVFAISAQDYTISYHPDDTLVGQDALVLGFDVADLETGNYLQITLGGQDLYCYVDHIGDQYYISTIPESDMAASRNLTVGVILFAFFAVMLMVVLYGIFIMHDDAKRGVEAADYCKIGPLRYNKAVGKKAAVLSFVGLLAVVLVSFYMQTLFALSSQSVVNASRVEDIQSTLERTEARASALTDQYKERYLDKCRTAGYILQQNPSLANHDSLVELADVLQIQSIMVIGNDGKARATSSVFNTFALSENPDDQSYEFWKLLRGTEELVQEAQMDDASGEWCQYIGVTMHDASGDLDGFVQITVMPTRLQTLLQSVEIENVLDGVRVGADGFAFAVNRSDNTFAYYPNEKLIGESVFDHGLSEAQLEDGYSDYLTIDGQTYYAASGTTGSYYVYVAGNEGELMAERMPLTLATGVVALVCLVVLFLTLVFGSGGGTAVRRWDNETDGAPEQGGATNVGEIDLAGGLWIAGDGDVARIVDGAGVVHSAHTDGAIATERRVISDGSAAFAVAGASEHATQSAREPKTDDISDKQTSERIVDVKMPSGRTVRTETADSRWRARAVEWNEKTPEQKLVTVMKWFGAITVAVVCVAVVFKNFFFGDSSIFSYILGGEWERGLNIFAVTACIMFACVAVTVASLVKKILMLFADVLSARGETVCRLLSSFIKYATIIGTVYYCLALVGVDTTALLASAGILSIAISLGAKELVSDIISGLFIIFEGEFRVGDIIKVGEWRGTVVEIGIRTTKVEDGSQNIKVIRNSNISDVINMTKRTSFTSVDMSIEYGESLERVEAILKQELPNVRKRLPAIVDGPFYKGVVMLGDNSVDLRILVQCEESDRIQLERDLMREMKLIFDRYDISIPYPQVVVNKPVEFKKATASEKMEASRFNEEQKEASRGLYVDGGGN